MLVDESLYFCCTIWLMSSSADRIWEHVSRFSSWIYNKVKPIYPKDIFNTASWICIAPTCARGGGTIEYDQGVYFLDYRPLLNARQLSHLEIGADNSELELFFINFKSINMVKWKVVIRILSMLRPNLHSNLWPSRFLPQVLATFFSKPMTVSARFF